MSVFGIQFNIELNKSLQEHLYYIQTTIPASPLNSYRLPLPLYGCKMAFFK